MIFPIALALLVFGQPVNADYDWDGKVDLRDFQVRQLMDPNLHADDPRAWVLIYNDDNSDSILHRDFYVAQHPGVHVFGVRCSSLEKIHKTQYIETIADPLRRWLAENPAINAQVLGFVVGFRVPGQYYITRDEFVAGMPWGDNVGGYSVAGSLQNLNDDRNWWQVGDTTTDRQFPTIENPHWFLATPDSDQRSLTRATMAPGHYMAARLDAPNLAIAKRLTTSPIAAMGTLCYDWEDSGGPRGLWGALQRAVDLHTSWAWEEYDSDAETPDGCWAQFSFYRLNWAGYRFNPGALAFAMNSYGAHSARSGTRFVPRALSAGFPIVLGATNEPTYGAEPRPQTLIWCLKRGWSVGEAFHRASRWENWMWTLFADPLVPIGRGTVIEP